MAQHGNLPTFLQRISTSRRRAPSFAAALLALITVVLLPSVALADEPDLFTRMMKAGPLWGAVGALLGGLLTALTPCVYPMIAITVSIFGAREAKSRGQAMLLSTCFVLGIVCLFTPMIVGAALTGSLFGSALANRWVIYGLAAFFIAMGTSMFGAFDLTLPEGMMQRLSTVGGIGYGGAFLLGLVSGLVAAPCTGPVLTSMLIWIGESRSVALGSAVGAAYSIGLGIPFWLVGTFAVALPKGGKWMLGVKSFFGIVMYVMAFYYLKNVHPELASLARPDTVFMLVTVAVVVVGLAMGAVHLAWDDVGTGIKLRKGVGIALAVAGAFLCIMSIQMPKGSLTWLHSEVEASAKAKAEKRPLMVDFTASWCVACGELAKHTFSDPRVMAKTANYVAVKVDATDDDDPQVGAVKDKYKVKGLPTVVIYDSTGAEKKRWTEFVGPDDFLAGVEGIN